MQSEDVVEDPFCEMSWQAEEPLLAGFSTSSSQLMRRRCANCSTLLSKLQNHEVSAEHRAASVVSIRAFSTSLSFVLSLVAPHVESPGFYCAQ